jgi:hypothetical protein
LFLFIYFYLQLSSGFIGSDEFHFYRAGTFLAVNTFGGEILFFLLCISSMKFILFFAHFFPTNGKDSVKFEMEENKEINNTEKIKLKKTKIDLNDNTKTELIEKHTEYDDMKKNEIIFVVVWCTYRVSVLTMSCMCAFLHRRHLMVWAVFAPKVSTSLSAHTLSLHLP